MANWQIILIIVALYCAVVLAVGVFTRTKGQTSLSDYSCMLVATKPIRTR